MSGHAFQPNFIGIILRAIWVDLATQNWSRCNLKKWHFFLRTPYKWRQTDKDHLANLINKDQINITDTSLPNIQQVRNLHFHHRDFSAAWDLEIECCGKWQEAAAAGEIHICVFVLKTALPQ